MGHLKWNGLIELVSTDRSGAISAGYADIGVGTSVPWCEAGIKVDRSCRMNEWAKRMLIALGGLFWAVGGCHGGQPVPIGVNAVHSWQYDAAAQQLDLLIAPDETALPAAGWFTPQFTSVAECAVSADRITVRAMAKPSKGMGMPGEGIPCSVSPLPRGRYKIIDGRSDGLLKVIDTTTADVGLPDSLFDDHQAAADE